MEKYYNNKKIGITGYAGYIGSALYYELKELNCYLKCIDVDVSNREEVKKVLEKNKFDIIFYLASAELPHNSAKIDDIMLQREVNSSSLLYFYDVVKDLDTKIVFTSSTNIYGRVEVDTVDENTKENPQSIWSIHKLLAENYINHLFKDFSILRLPNVYGVNNKMVKNNLNLEVIMKPVINRVIKAGMSESRLHLFQNKDCLRDYLYIDDVVHALLLSGIYCSDEKYYVLGSSDKKTISNVWEIISEKLNGILIEYDDINLDLMEMRSYIGDYSLFNQFTGWNPKVNLQEGISETIKNLKKIGEN